jgi:uridylate kinase
MRITPGSRILLKISGEFLQGQGTHGVCWDTLDSITQALAELPEYQWVIMVGGGNFFRGHQGASYCGQGIADSMGMMSTHLNGLALMAGFHRAGLNACLMTARRIEGVGSPFNVSDAHNALITGSVLICTGGLGHGAMTTDTAAVVRACELDCQWIIKGTSVKGIYSADPKKDPMAAFYPHTSYDAAIQNNLAIVDMTALTLAKAYSKSMIIFSLKDPQGLGAVLDGTMEFSLLDQAGPRVLEKTAIHCTHS